MSTVVDMPNLTEATTAAVSSDTARAVLATLFRPPAARQFLVHYWDGIVEVPEPEG